MPSIFLSRHKKKQDHSQIFQSAEKQGFKSQNKVYDRAQSLRELSEQLKIKNQEKEGSSYRKFIKYDLRKGEESF